MFAVCWLHLVWCVTDIMFSRVVLKFIAFTESINLVECRELFKLIV